MKLKELFEDALPIITKFAPTVGTALGGQFGFAAGYLIPILAKAFGSHPTNLPELAHNIITDPNTEDKLKQIEHEHCDWLCTTLDSVSNLASAEINIKLNWQTEKGN